MSKLKRDDFRHMVRIFNKIFSYLFQDISTLQYWRWFVVFGSFMIFASINLLPSMSYREVLAIEDTFHVKLEPINKWFSENPKEKDLIVVISTFLSDLVLIVMMVEWTFYCKSWRLPICLVLLFFIKAICSVSKIRVSSDYTFRQLLNFPIQTVICGHFHSGIQVSLSTLDHTMTSTLQLTLL